MANLGTINTGLVFGFSAVAIPQLEDADSFIKIDEEQASWIGKYTEQVDSSYDLQMMSTYLYMLPNFMRNIVYTYAPQLIGAECMNVGTIQSFKNRFLKAYETCKNFQMILVTVEKQPGKL